MVRQTLHQFPEGRWSGICISVTMGTQRGNHIQACTRSLPHIQRGEYHASQFRVTLSRLIFLQSYYKLLLLTELTELQHVLHGWWNMGRDEQIYGKLCRSGRMSSRVCTDFDISICPVTVTSAFLDQKLRSAKLHALVSAVLSWSCRSW